MVKKYRFHTQWPEEPNFGSFEAFTEPSMTEPDNSMSIPEIIARYTRGQGIQVQQYPWQSGQAAPEEGEGVLQDGTAEALLELASQDLGQGSGQGSGEGSGQGSGEGSGQGSGEGPGQGSGQGAGEGSGQGSGGSSS